MSSSLKSTLTSAAPVVLGVIGAGLVLYYVGGSVPFLATAAKGLAGQNQATAAASTSSSSSILTTLENLL